MQRPALLQHPGLITAWSMLLLSQSALANVDYFDLTPEQLLSAEVLSVSKKAESIATAPAAVYIVTSEDIQRSGVTTIPDALRMVPGMQVARVDSNSWAISIRGFNTVFANKLLVLIDGRTVYNPVFGGVFWETHDLMLEDIERIEVIRGPGGTLWGANAVNGVINIRTKHTRNTQGTIVSALYGDEEQGTLNVRQGGTFGDAGTYRFYAKGFQRDASHNPVGGDTYDEWEGFRTGFRADWGDEFTLQGDAYRTNAEQLRRHFSFIAPFDPIEEQTIVYEGVNLLGRWTDSRADGSQFSIQSYVDWAQRDEPINFVDNRIIYDLEAQYNFAPLGAHEVTTGAGFRFLADDQEGDNNTAFSPQKRRNNLYSAFIQDKITLAPDAWFLTLGSKFEHNEFSGYEVQPNIRLQWHASQTQTVWSSISRAVRTPTPLETDLTSTLLKTATVRAAFVPNDDFKSEKLTAYELGYRQQLTSLLSMDLAVFYNDYDYLQTVSILAPVPVINGIDPPHLLVPVKFTNDMTGKTDGFEAVLNWSANEDLKIAVNYSFLHINLDALLPTQEGGESLYPRHQAGTKIFWNINDDWTLDTSATYVDKLPAGNVDSYIRLDINLGGYISKNLRFNLVGQNLTASHHREFGAATDLNAGEIERSIFGKLTWQF